MKCIIENKKLVCGFRDELKASQNIIRSGILFLLSILFINNASAGGFGLGVTRLIYPAESKQITLSVQNSGDNTSYLIQSWVDDSKTEKKARILLSHPLYLCCQRVKKLHYVSCFLVRLICRPIVKLCIG
ncbi:fimbria/pilus periplasmic chaperone [Escherichia coli]|uniref:fimbria/pilus periplasmic chaperone n=1 Tax=Escherichia coli TaxID=562 RepID=UPI001562C0E7|nr:fimbria/pilus periplasmic chaperone [Escherichia coli]EHV2970072.1 fimbria/pilus periplasmic chaperone [Escherichia coli]EHY3708102.1 fimbria/pilus periplasmic chaperone [Escherichia coli]EIN4508507.1 fimbria/pilus periplasmic chaperone [Escherichia coli]EKE4304434.1 fimbria/pilus periplasmic chaperone [Escherichia coli]ELF2443695.1 fimbria/pilus periplasmic chaperone [Escherichia coli]